MRHAALLLIGLATASIAGAQAGPARVAFTPMPNTLPALLFAPDSLAGTMLKPLTEPAPDATAFAEVRPEPAAAAVTAATRLADDLAPATVAERSKPELVQNVGADVAQDTAGGTAPEPTPDAPSQAAIEPQPATPASPPPAAPPQPAPPPANAKESTVTVIVENVQTSTGTVNVAVCDKSLSKEGCPYVHEVPAQQGFVETEFRDLPPGNYAVVGYHDVNGNNQFDKLMGIPREPYALSNNASDKLVPTFADAELPIKRGENAVIIRLKKLGG